MIELVYDLLVADPDALHAEVRRLLNERRAILVGTSTSDSPPATRVYLAQGATTEDKAVVDRAIASAARRAAPAPTGPVTAPPVSSEKRKPAG